MIVVRKSSSIGSYVAVAVESVFPFCNDLRDVFSKCVSDTSCDIIFGVSSNEGMWEAGSRHLNTLDREAV